MHEWLKEADRSSSGKSDKRNKTEMAWGGKRERVKRERKLFGVDATMMQYENFHNFRLPDNLGAIKAEKAAWPEDEYYTNMKKICTQRSDFADLQSTVKALLRVTP